MQPITLSPNVELDVDKVKAPQTSIGKTRLPMIDIAKGISILLIVFGHEVNLSSLLPELRDTLKSIRIPFFFFLSGVTFSVERRTVSQIAMLRGDAWLKPYVITALFFGLINIFVYQTHDYENVALGILYGTGFTLSPTAIWFLPHLWLLYVISAALLIHGGLLINSLQKRLLLLASLIVGGYYLLSAFDSSAHSPERWVPKDFTDDLVSFGLPFSADLLPISMTFLLLGHFLSKQTKAFQSNIACVCAAAILLWILCTFFDHSMDLNYRRYDHLFITTAQSLAGIYLLLCLSSVISKTRHLAQALIFIGRRSLFILLFHMPILADVPALFSPLIPSKTVVSLCCFILAIIIPIGLWQLANRFYATRFLFLPILQLKRPGKENSHS